MKKHICIIKYGGLGDVALSTPIFKALKVKFPECKITLLCFNKSEVEICENNPYIDSLILCNGKILFLKYRKYMLLAYLGLVERYYLDYAKLCPSLLYSKRATELIADLLDVELQDKNIQIFLKEEENLYAEQMLSKYKKPIIIQVTAACTKNKNWPFENWEKLIDQMPDYTFIQLGLSKEIKIKGAVDMRGATNVRESMALIKNSLCFVGVDSFLSHITNAFDIPGVVLFGPSSSSIWGHPNNINISKQLPCSPCIDISLYQCPFDKPCMRDITIQEVKEAIYLQLSNKNN